MNKNFIKFIEKEDNGCWIWTGHCYSNGYGQFHVNRMPVYAHRFSYSQVKGTIPNGLEIDHVCRNTRCVNPDHLEAVTPKENSRRRASMITHCPQGHEYNKKNTYIWHLTNRRCRACDRERKRKYRLISDKKDFDNI